MTTRLKIKLTGLFTPIARVAVSVAEAFARPAPELERLMREIKPRY